MKTKKSSKLLLIGITSLLIAGLGSIWYVNVQKEVAEPMKNEKKKEIVTAEKNSVKALKQTFKNIKKVKFNETKYNKVTGANRMFITMTNTQGKSVDFSYSFWSNNGEIGSYGIEDSSVQIEGITKDKIEVEYSNGELDEI